MLGAIVYDDIVDNVIVVNEAQIPELEAALGCEIVDAAPYELMEGDLRTPAGWTRNVNGEQVILPEVEPEEANSYKKAIERIEELEEQQEAVAQAAADEAAAEAMAILTGEIEVEDV